MKHPAPHATAHDDIVIAVGTARHIAERVEIGHGVERIVAQPVVEVGLGRAVMDRLRRAAATMPG